MEKTTIIPTYAILGLRKDLTRINRKADKLGLSHITYKENGEPTYRPCSFIDPETNRKSTETIEFVSVTLEGPDIKIDDWGIVAKLEFDQQSNTNIIKNIQDFDVPEQYHSRNTCEHCNHKRQRINTYILKHRDGTLKQVGSTCIKDFTKCISADQILSMWSGLGDLFNTYEELGDPDFEHFGRAERMLELNKFMIFAVLHIQEFGFQSAASCGEEEYPTSHKVAIEYQSSRLPDEIDDKVKETCHYIMSSYIKTLKELDKKNSFQANIITLFSTPFFDIKYAGYVTAAINSGIKEWAAVQYDLAHPNERESNDYVGVPSEHLTLKLHVADKSSYTNNYGEGSRYLFKDGTGNHLIWFTSGKFSPEIGQELDLKFKIKDHKEWKSKKQTTITHVKKVAK